MNNETTVSLECGKVKKTRIVLRLMLPVVHLGDIDFDMIHISIQDKLIDSLNNG